MASYCHYTDQRIKKIPWKIYTNLPDPNNKDQVKSYESKPTNQFGEWRLEEVLLDFKPDCVFSIRDMWMDCHIAQSPLKPYFNWSWMAPCDSYPQAHEWIDMMINDIDHTFTYSDWAQKILKKEGGGLINLCGTAPAGANKEHFFPIPNKAELRKHYQLKPDVLIVGTVMRNQKRKLFPDLFQAFKQYLDKCKANNNKALWEKSFLLAHTSHPDIGWDIPRIAQEHGIVDKLLFTYACRENKCGYVFISFFQDSKAVCPKCGQPSAGLPHVQTNIEPKVLGQIYNCMDIYVQYSMCVSKDTDVFTDQGWKQIQDIKLGDNVLTHKNRFRPVIKTFVNPNKGNVKKLKVWCNEEELLITDNHPIWSISKKYSTFNKDKSIREQCGDALRKNMGLPEPDFVSVANLSAGDLIGFPIDQTIKDINQIDLAIFASEKDEIKDTTIKVFHGDEYPRYIEIDNEFCEFMGLFAADGHWQKSGKICITCNSSEKINFELAKEQMSRLSNHVSYRKYPDRNAIDICIYSVLHSRFFENNFKKREHKQLPQWVDKLSLDKQKRILYGLCLGDGCYSNDIHNSNPRNITSYSTISKKLTEQIKILLQRNKIYYNCRLINKNKYNKTDNYNRKPQYRFEICGNIQNNEFVTKRSNSRSLYHNDILFLQIKSIEKSDYVDQVFNIEVKDDNSYTVKLGNIHNCEGLGIPQVEAAACGVPVMSVDYSAMETVVRKLKGYPIKVQRLFREAETHAYRAYPDNTDFVDKLYNFFSLPESMRKKKGFDAHLMANKYFNWDDTAKTWDKHFEKIEYADWDLPPRLHQPPQSYPTIQDNEHFVTWCIENILGDPSKLYTYFALKLIRNLNYGVEQKGYGGIYFNDQSLLGIKQEWGPFDRKKLIKMLLDIVENRNYWEKRRCGIIKEPIPPFIQVANQ